MLTISYFIMVHNSPEGLDRLIQTLQASNVLFVVHVDAKAEIAPFKIVATKYNNVKFTLNRCDVKWGDYSIAGAYIEGLKTICDIAPDSYVIHLSGQDYPLKSNDYIRKHIELNSTKIFMCYFHLPWHSWSGNGGLNRVYSYYYVMPNKRIAVITPLSISFANCKNLLRLIVYSPRLFPKAILNFFQKRKHPLNYSQHFGGEFWISMPTNIAKQILNLLENNPSILTYYKSCGHPDEIMLQTLIMNNVKWNVNVENHCLRYIDWSDFKTTGSPVNLSLSEKDNIAKAQKDPNILFARKFSSNNSEILDLIDLALLETLRPK